MCPVVLAISFQPLPSLATRMDELQSNNKLLPWLGWNTLQTCWTWQTSWTCWTSGQSLFAIFHGLCDILYILWVKVSDINLTVPPYNTNNKCLLMCFINESEAGTIHCHSTVKLAFFPSIFSFCVWMRSVNMCAKAVIPTHVWFIAIIYSLHTNAPDPNMRVKWLDSDILVFYWFWLLLWRTTWDIKHTIVIPDFWVRDYVCKYLTEFDKASDK